MVVFLILLAILGWVGGSFLLTQATMGVGALAAACLFAILARIAQASQQQRQTTHLLERILQLNMPPPDDPEAARLWQCRQCGQLNGLDLFDCARCQVSRSAAM